MNSIKPFPSLSIIIKYYTTNSIKPFFSLLVINKYYTTNCIKPLVAIQFIILNFCRQLLSNLCISNKYSDQITCTKITLIKQHAPK